MFGPLNIGMTNERAREKAMQALATVGLQNLADENPYDLELSERKLVAIASVLAMDTAVLILDEPNHRAGLQRQNDHRQYHKKIKQRRQNRYRHSP